MLIFQALGRDGRVDVLVPHQPEIQHLQCAFGSYLEVRRRQAVMDHALFMSMIEGQTQLPAQLHDFIEIERAAAQIRLDAGSFDKFRGQENSKALEAAGMKFRDIRMIQCVG